MWSETPRICSVGHEPCHGTHVTTRHITTLHWVCCISVAVVMGYYGEVCDILIWSIVTMVTQWLVYV